MIGQVADVNKCQQELFTKKSRPVEGCPPMRLTSTASLQNNIWTTCTVTGDG